MPPEKSRLLWGYIRYAGCGRGCSPDHTLLTPLVRFKPSDVAILLDANKIPVFGDIFEIQQQQSKADAVKQVIEALSQLTYNYQVRRILISDKVYTEAKDYIDFDEFKVCITESDFEQQMRLYLL